MTDDDLPTRVEIAGTTYTLRRFQTGPGHDWLRHTPGTHTHRSASAEVNRLVDEIIQLRLTLNMRHETTHSPHPATDTTPGTDTT